MEFGTAQAILRSSRAVNSTVPAFSFRVKFFAQLMQSQKCSIRLADVGNPKKRPPSIRMSNREQRGLAHLEIIRLPRKITLILDAEKAELRRPAARYFFHIMTTGSEMLFPKLNRGNFSDLYEVASGFQRLTVAVILP